MTVAYAPRPESLPSPSDKFVVVEASAGTGKTYFLEHRVVDLVLAGAELGEILLVTFTDKAVAELRLRIRDLLDRLARTTQSSDASAPSGWRIDDVARARLRAAVNVFDRAPIFTIHGFCHRVLIEDAFAGSRLFEQTQVADDVAFDAAFIDLVRSRFATVAPEVELLGAYLARGDTIDKLRALLLACARKAASPRTEFNAEAARSIGAELRAAFGTAEVRAALLNSLPLVGNDKRYAPGWLDLIGRAVEQWDGSGAGALAVCDAIRRSGKSRSEPGLNLLSRLAKSAAHSQTADVLRRALAQMSLDAAVASVMLPSVVTHVGAAKAEGGMFDYDDMLRLVRDALHGPRGGELADRLRRRMPWVMIDEFQDTDVVQWDIFRTIWLGPQSRGLTIVGDPKQAIYGFRGADVATYLEARDELVRNGATVVQLDVNYRATAAMVDAVNCILAGDGISPLLDQGIRYDHPVTASTDVSCATPQPPIAVFALHGTGGRDENRQALARAIAAEIECLRASPARWSSRGETPPFSLDQVMVLTRTNQDCGQIAVELRARGLACAVVENDGLFDTREAAELVAVLAAVAAPRDRSARLRALRSRFFDVAWRDVMRVVDAPDHHPLIGRLSSWAALAARRAYEPLLRSIVEDSGFAERTLIVGGGERALINTWHLTEILLAEVARSRCDLHELVAKLRRWISDASERPDDRDVQRAESDADAVRILTIHKAKGLEAPYVFLFGAASALKAANVHTVRESHGRSLVVGPQADAVTKLVEAEVLAENQRLAYVALTRAKVRLYLPHYSDGTVDAKSMYHSIERCLRPLMAHPNEHIEIVDVDIEQNKAVPVPPNALAGFEPPQPPTLVELAAIAGAKAGLTMLSYTSLSRSLDEVELVPHVAGARAVAAHELPAGADSGLFLHDLFERVDLQQLRQASDPDSWAQQPRTAALIAETARSRGIAALFHRHAAHIVYATLAQPLSLADGAVLPPLAEATQLAREVEFVYPIGRGSNGLVKGYIDALVAWDDQLWIVDYKSDVLAGDPIRTAASHVHDHYTVQQRLYALAADRMRGDKTLAGMLFPFVRYGVAAVVRFDPDKLAAWATWLESIPCAA